MIEARIDFETRAAVNLTTAGQPRYFACPQFRPLIASYRIGDGPMRRWQWGEPIPRDLECHILMRFPIRAWNASFERGVLQWLEYNCYWPDVKVEQFVCTAAEAAAMALPRKLEKCALALGLDEQKDAGGAALIRFFSMPRRDGLFNEPEDHPEKFEAFKAYCDQDVVTEEAVAARVFPLSDAEQALYTLDQRINARGVRIDMVSVEAALRLAEKAKRALDAEMAEVTGGAVRTTNQVAKLVAWVEAQGVAMPSAGKADVEDLLAGYLPEHVEKAILLRQEGAKSSVNKLKAMKARVSADSRVRNSFLFTAAGTRRWSSTGVQWHNMPRPRREYDGAKLDLRVLLDTFQTEDPGFVRFMYGPKLGRPLDLISDAIRSFIWAAPGHTFVQADYSGIEDAVIAWIANEGWKLDLLRQTLVDPSIPDMHRRTAARILGTTTDVITKKHPMRQDLGKVGNFSLGYGGGVSAFFGMSRNYGVKLDPLFGPVWDGATEAAREKAVKRHERCLRRGESKADLLSREAWLACELVKVGWRADNPATVGAWEALEEALRNAVRHPGQEFSANRVSYLVTQGFLFCKLPAGGVLAYASPRLRDQVWVRWTGESDLEIMPRDQAERIARFGELTIERAAKQAVTALGADAGKWVRFALYGGLAFNNVVQGTARDLLANGMQKAEAAGYPIVLHVHDELVSEVPIGFGSVAEFERIICELPEWADGLPLAAEGWTGKRYHK